MSEYEDQMDGSDVICPYCEHRYQKEAEDYSDDVSVEECDECGKKYRQYDSFSVDHHTEPNCNENSEDHIWESHDLRNGQKHDFCSVCGQCRSHRDN